MRTVIVAAAAALVLLASSTAQAQASATPGSAVQWDQVDVADVAAAQARQFFIYSDGVRTTPAPVDHKCGTPASDAVAGAVATCFAPFPAITPGNHSLQVSAAELVNGVLIEGALSDPFPVRLVVAPGKVPNVRVR